MKFYKEKSKIWELFTQANIHSLIAPFGFEIPYRQFDFKTKCRIICQPNFIERCKKYNAEIKTMPKLHTKLAIGYNGTLFGSFNFTTSHQKELVAFFDSPQEIEEALCEFDYWWAKATPVKP